MLINFIDTNRRYYNIKKSTYRVNYYIASTQGRISSGLESRLIIIVLNAFNLLMSTIWNHASAD